MQLRPRASVGFTLVELAVGMAIVAILIALGLPSLSSYLQGSKLRDSARSFYTGLQLARTEAIRLNLPVQFVLTDTPLSNTVAKDAVASATGRNWVVRVVNPDGSFTLVQAKSAAQGSGQAGAVSSVAVAGDFDAITFNGLGGPTVGAGAVFAFSNPAGGACATVAEPNGMRCLSVVVGAGGQARICDGLAAAGDTRAC